MNVNVTKFSTDLKTMPNNDGGPARDQPLEPRRRLNGGHWTVVVMFSFALTMILALYLYWDLYTRPFRPLQYAIAEVFPDSSPKVIGGQHKSHKDNSPVLLRIVVDIPVEQFDPTVDVEASEERALELCRLAFEHHDVNQYEQIDIVLLQKVPEGARKRWSISRSLSEWQQRLGRM